VKVNPVRITYFFLTGANSFVYGKKINKAFILKGEWMLADFCDGVRYITNC